MRSPPDVAAMSSTDAIVFSEPHDVTLAARDRPEPGPEQVLVETDRSLVSIGTELTLLSGDYPEGSDWDEYGTYPLVPGYNNVGTVTAVGEGVAESFVGTRVATWSGHAAHVVADRDACTAVPEAVSSEEAAFFAMAQIAMNGVRRGRVDWGEGVCVYGCGLVGQLAARFCHVAGARPVVGLDVADSRLDFLPTAPGMVGANPETSDPDEVVRGAANGRRADVVFEATGLPDAIPEEFDVLREQGRLVLLSSPRGRTEFDFHDLCNAPSYEIIGAHQASHPTAATPSNPWTKDRHAELFFEYLREDAIDVESLVTDRVSHEDAPEVYRSLLEDRTDSLGVVIEW
jgi:2-desacetyl-2-hydroxyethyl bacteriochlorophyllide A dehydrogenase